MVTFVRWTRSPLLLGGIILAIVASALLPLAAQFGVGAGGPAAFISIGSTFHWEPILVGLHLVTDLLIGLSYVAISATLIRLARKAGQDIPFLWAFVAFGLFIVSCGMTHFVAALTLWAPLYWVAGGVKYITALASVGTAVAIPPLVPQVLTLIHDAKLSDQRRVQLEETNSELAALTTRLTELDQTKTRFFASVSHELRTPLALIVGPIDLLRDAPNLTAEQQQSVAIMERHARLLRRHVDELLDVARLEAGTMDLHPTLFDLAQLVQLVAAQFEPLAHQRHVTLSLEVPATFPLYADSEKLQRSVVNLLANAFSFAPADGLVRLTVRLSDDRIRIEVADSGPGVPPELRDVIFEPFRQGETRAAHKLGGTGLGLAIVKECIVLHGGDVSVDTAPEGGACFTISLPMTLHVSGMAVSLPRPDTSDLLVMARQAVIEMEPARSVPLQAEEQREPATDVPRILVVEDNADMQHLIAVALSTTYHLTVAMDGQDALTQLQAHPPDLIISDLMMPRMDGEELLGAVRQRPEFDGIPTLLLTARTDEELRARLLRSGAQDYLVKPFTVTELQARVHNLVVMKRVRDVLQRELTGQRQDLTEMAQSVARRRQEADDANRAKDEFLSHAAHELKTPLTVLLGNVQLSTLYLHRLRDTLAGDATALSMLSKLQEFHQRADGQIDRLTRLVNDLLDVARIEEHKLKLHLQSCDLAAIVASVVGDQAAASTGRVIELTVADNAATIPILADADRLRQVIGNYLSNALKYAPPDRPIRVHVSRDMDWVRVSVSDEGPGVPIELQAKIWERSYQVSNMMPLSGSHIGLGLGLYISRTIIEEHHGTVGVDSHVGQGATFWFTLPLVAVDRPSEPNVAGSSSNG